MIRVDDGWGRDGRRKNCLMKWREIGDDSLTRLVERLEECRIDLKSSDV
jgi:hypothetical protein